MDTGECGLEMNRTRSRACARRRARDRPPAFRGWISTDEDEVRRREWRGRTEIDEVRALDPDHAPFGDYRVRSPSGDTCVVEIRSLRELINSCECPDFRTNRLGTCKHIEGVRRQPGGVRASRATKRRASERIEVFLGERNGQVVRMTVLERAAAGDPHLVQEAERLLASLRRGSGKALGALRKLALDHRDTIRVSRRLDAWVDDRRTWARHAAGCLAASAGEPAPEDAESAAAYLLWHEFDAGECSGGRGDASHRRHRTG